MGTGTALLRRLGIGRALALCTFVVAGAVAAVVLAPRDRAPDVALGPPRFVDETADAGIDTVYDGDAAFAVGGGVAAFDCNGDGMPDLFVAGGRNPAALYRNDSAVGGALRFTRIASPVTDVEEVIGAYPLDIFGSGQADLVVLRKRDALVLRGLGDCRFEQAQVFDGENALTTAFSAQWEGTSALPTLAFGRYLKLDQRGALTSDCADNLLVRPRVDRSGYADAMRLAPGYCALSMLFSDWDRSGRRDLRISNDRQYYVNGQEQLWRMDAGAPPRLYTAADGWVNLQIWGMGIASYDLTGRGYPDVFLTSQGDNKLQTLTAGPGQPTYRDMALKRGVLAAQPFTGGDVEPSTAWHPEFADVNNDGFVDLFISKGNVSTMSEYAQRDPSDLLLGQPDGTFSESAAQAGVLNFDRGRGAVVADFNLDGLLDIVEVNYGAPVRVWRNVGSGSAERPAALGNWLAVRLSQPGPNPDAIGAWIEVQLGSTTLRRELTVGGGHAGGQLGWVHFGLGSSPLGRLRVIWPDETVGPWLSVNANQFAVIDRGTSDVRAWTPPAAGPQH